MISGVGYNYRWAPLVQYARQLNPLSVDVAPVTLKEIFLESVAVED